MAPGRGPGSAGANKPPPTLRPFLEHLPPPNELIADQRTPTGPRFEGNGRSVSSPTKIRPFDLGDEDGDGDDDDDDVTLEDEDFEARISRQSPASTASEDDEEEEEDSEVEAAPLATDNRFAPVEGSHRSLQRIKSLPASSQFANGQPHGQLHTSQSTTALRLPPPPPPPLYPPFYNRPPTPLPPSPSLTSLLRPPSLLNRSTTSTRPTTPDSSDVETPLDTEAAVAHSARRAHPLPPTSPKVPTYEYYGFVLYLTSFLVFLMYLLWAYLPSPFLHALGITYYPDRWWALAIPAWIVMLLIFIYVALLSYNVEYLTLPMDSAECMVDEAGSVAILEASGRIRKGGSKRFAQELKQKKRLDEERQHSASWGKSSRRRKKERDREKEREKEEQYYGFLATDGRSLSDLNLSWKQIWNEATDAVMDVPIGGVCEVLYGDG